MPRIPDTEIDRIKTETDLVALIQSRGVALRQQGANWTGLCPFHDDTDTPNLIVTPGKGLWRCMASCCGATGNAIQFVEKFDGLSFRHAFEVLATGGKAAFEHSPGAPRKQATVPRLPCPIESTAGDGVAHLFDIVRRCRFVTVSISSRLPRFHRLLLPSGLYISV